MKLIQIVNAKRALEKLITQDLPLKEAFALVNMVDSCNGFLKFYGNEIIKINPETEPERLKELNDMEVDFNPEIIRVNMNTKGLTLSAANVKSLESFVEFYDMQE